MPDQRWPTYEIGPHDSVFALGVASVNYSRLEFALGGVFANVVGLTDAETWAKLPKLQNDKRVSRLRRALEDRDWPTEAKQQIEHFIDGFEILYQNRNLLMHSNLMAGVRDLTALYKHDKSSGRTVLTEITKYELRQVADDMMTYFDYGLYLSNIVAFKLLGGRRAMELLGVEIKGPVFEKWPEKPPLPSKLQYQSQP